MAMTYEEFARSIEDPYQMFSYIDTGLCHIKVCKQHLEIRRYMFEMKRMDKAMFREEIKNTMIKILNELIVISIYVNSKPYQKEFLLLGERNNNSDINVRGFFDRELFPESVQSRVMELITEIREILNKESFTEVLKIKDYKEILKILK